MRKKVRFFVAICLLFLFVFSSGGFVFASSSYDQIRDLRSPETGKILLGMGIQYLVPDQLKGFESTQMVFCPRLYFPLGPGHFQLGSSYGTGSGIYPEIDHVFFAELGYRFFFETRFFGSFLSAGGLYSRYFSEMGDEKIAGPFVATGLVFSLAKGFKMGAELRLIQLEKPILGFGGQFTIAL